MMRRELFESTGGFAEDLPACEDYDLWLRIAATEPVHLIDTPLVIKRGGHADQLSHRFWGMDRFRVAALCKLLASRVLTLEQRKQAEEVLLTKCRILAQGAWKRGQDGEVYLRLAATYAGKETMRQGSLAAALRLRSGEVVRNPGLGLSDKGEAS